MVLLAMLGLRYVIQSLCHSERFFSLEHSGVLEGHRRGLQLISCFASIQLR